MNKVILMGRLTADPELRQTQSGVQFCRFTVAVNRRFKNAKTGETEADFPVCQAWRQTAEFVSKYFHKGDMISIEGALRTGSFQDRNHSDVTHYTTDVFVENVEFCGSKSERNNGSNYTTPPTTTPQSVVQAAQTAGIPTQQMTYGDLKEFEEILSDGDVPF